MLAVLNFCQCMRNPCLFVFCCGNLYIYIWWMNRYPTSFRAGPTRFLLVFHAILTHILKYCICAIFCLFQIWASLAFGRMGECKRLMSPHPYQVPQHQHIAPMLFFFYTVMMMVHGKHDYHCNRFIIIGRLRSFCFFAQLTYFFVLVAQSKTSQWAKRDRATWKWPCWSWRASSSSPSSPSPSSTMSSSSSPSSSTAAFATSTTISWWIVFVIRNRKSGMECM